MLSAAEQYLSRVSSIFKVIDGIYEGVTTVELDNLAAETAAYKTTTHPDYAVLAARIAISNLHKETRKIFSQVVKDLYDYGEFISSLLLASPTDHIVTSSEPKEQSPQSNDFGYHLRTHHEEQGSTRLGYHL